MLMGMRFISCCGCFKVVMVMILFAFVAVTILVTITLLLQSLTVLGVLSGVADVRADALNVKHVRQEPETKKVSLSHFR